ncbi:MAG: septal ring lytic transglycosylase RlpA family protein [Salinivirgaceae bacterium]
MNTLKPLLIVLALFGCLNSRAQITEFGLASFYADKFDGRITASGETFDQRKLTAAHRTLPFGTTVKVTNLENKKTVRVVINDRGPFIKDRVIDLSKAAAEELGFIKEGVTQVKLEVLNLNSSDKAAAPAPKRQVVISRAASDSRSQGSDQASSVASEGLEYYSLKSQLTVPSGFGIQVASYQEAANLMKLCDELQQKTNKEIIVQVSKQGDNKLYRVILGTFPSREAAGSYLDKYKRQFPGSFVMAF